MDKQEIRARAKILGPIFDELHKHVAMLNLLWQTYTKLFAKSEQRLGYGFMDDAAQYEAAPDFHQRALILHGTQDTVVPSEVSHNFALEHTRVRLALLKSGHELTDVLESLWQETSGFLEIPAPGVV